MRHGVALLALVAVVATGCSDTPEPYYPPDEAEAGVSTAYDASAEPSAAALTLVPESATRLEVTDYDQLRLTLGYGALDGSSPAGERAAFWREVGDATLTDGVLQPVDDQLRSRFALGQDDVAWEARYDGDASGWVVVFHDDVPIRRIQRAVNAGIGPLAGATLHGKRRIVSSEELPDPEQSWAAVPELHDLVGREANATYVERGCVPLDEIYGDGLVDRLDGQAERDAASLRALDAYSVAFGGELLTVLLGPEREDAFTRLRLARHLPVLQPEFGSVFAGGVASPADGELGYRIPRPRQALDWVEQRRLPFAACDV